ncbi:MAG: hypothetical protein LIO96_01300 [Lachnospiraceae bacterium]|nr:hypothetical protein [Lachnospiraceae bacterium]
MKKNTKRPEQASSATPYDDVYRTMMNDCSPLLIPVINEVFGEHFTGKEEIRFSPNEHFINQQDGGGAKRITDSAFAIIGVKTKKYLMECQSTPDNSMLVRIFEYATQVALDEGNMIGDTLQVEIPNCAVLFLRSNRNTPDLMHLEITAAGGTLTIDVPVLKVLRYSLDRIFEKKLYFLLPFYIFTHEKDLAEYETNEEKLDALKKEYAVIMECLDALAENKELSYYYKKIIVEMAANVVENLAAKYDRVRDGVKSVMGGKFLNYEAKTIYLEGVDKV